MLFSASKYVCCRSEKRWCIRPLPMTQVRAARGQQKNPRTVWDSESLVSQVRFGAKKELPQHSLRTANNQCLGEMA